MENPSDDGRTSVSSMRIQRRFEDTYKYAARVNIFPVLFGISAEIIEPNFK
jgi:hypothetical protein